MRCIDFKNSKIEYLKIQIWSLKMHSDSNKDLGKIIYIN